MGNRPGGELAGRPMYFIWIVDCSGSMSGLKIQELNTAIKEALPHMRQVADENPNARLLVRVLKFSSGAQWVAQETPVADFKWTDLTADGVTDMGNAMRLLAEALKMPPMPERALPPVLVLLSDGQPTDDFGSGLQLLMEQPWAKKAVRLAIAIGQDADREVLQKFIGNPELKPLEANNPEQLVNRIKWVSTQVVKAASTPAIQGAGPGGSPGGVPIPLPADAGSTSGDDVW